MVAANRFAGRRFGKVRPPSSGPAEPNAREWCHRPSARHSSSFLFWPSVRSPVLRSLRHVPVRYSSRSCCCRVVFFCTFSVVCGQRVCVCVSACVRASVNYDYYFLCFKTGFQLGLSSCWPECCARHRVESIANYCKQRTCRSVLFTFVSIWRVPVTDLMRSSFYVFVLHDWKNNVVRKFNSELALYQKQKHGELCQLSDQLPYGQI